MSAASTIIDAPIAQITWRKQSNLGSTLKVTPNRTTVTSSTTSHNPRVKRKRDKSRLLLPRASCKYAPVPASKTKTGAQKCVIQRVRNNQTVVFERSSGSKKNTPE